MKLSDLLRLAILMTVLPALLALLGYAIGGATGGLIALAVGALINFAGLSSANGSVLRMVNARSAGVTENPEVYNALERLAEQMGIATPALYVIDNAPAPNVLAVGGPKRSAVVVTDGLAKALSPDELESVLAHELAHVKTRSTLVAATAAAMAGPIIGASGRIFGGKFSYEQRYGVHGERNRDRSGELYAALAVTVIAFVSLPVALAIIHFAVSRGREYAADAAAAALTGKPAALVGAIEKIDSAAHDQSLNINPAAVPLFIVNPLGENSLSRLYSTHPPTNKRVARLQQLTDE